MTLMADGKEMLAASPTGARSDPTTIRLSRDDMDESQNDVDG